MPYIKEREAWDTRLTPVLDNINSETDAGVMNYLITKMLWKWCKDAVGKIVLRYLKICMVMGTLICVAFEFYRRIAAPYEDIKIKENGDVYN